MKKHFREIAAFAGILASILLFVSAFALAADDGAGGKKLFEAKCAQCHGKDAKGVAKMAKVLKVEPTMLDLTRAEAVSLSAEDMEKTVSTGKKKMPKYKGKLTEDQIKAVVEYAKSLQVGSSGGK